MSRAALLTAVALACAGVARAETDEAALRGRHLVQRNCVGCHNAAAGGRSVYSAAPPLRTLRGHTPETLQRVALEAAAGAHFGMPSILLTPSEARDIAAYIQALAEGDAETRRRLSAPSCVGTTC